MVWHPIKTWACNALAFNGRSLTKMSRSKSPVGNLKGVAMQVTTGKVGRGFYNRHSAPQPVHEGKLRRPGQLLDKENPIQGPIADSEEKHEPASDIDTALVDSLKVLDPEGPIREADIPPMCLPIALFGRSLCSVPSSTIWTTRDISCCARP